MDYFGIASMHVENRKLVKNMAIVYIDDFVAVGCYAAFQNSRISRFHGVQAGKNSMDKF